MAEGNIFDDAKLAGLATKIRATDKGTQRLGEVSARALNDKEFRKLVFTPSKVSEKVKADAALTGRLSAQNMGELSDDELAYLTRWAELAEKAFAGDDKKLVKAIEEQGDRGPSG